MERFPAIMVQWLIPCVILCGMGFGQITPSADSYTTTADPTTNYGAATLLYVKGATEATYIQFNLASIPSGASISQATLKLYVNSVTTAGSFNVDYVNGEWTESTITNNDSPVLGSTIVSDVAVSTADKNQYILINVTSAMQAWLSGSEANNGIALVANSTFNATFDSKENTTTSHPAELDIAYAGGDGTITGVETAAGSGLTGGGTSGNLNLSLTEACSANQILVWSGSAWACGNLGSGGGAITGVIAGAGLTGGGTSGNVTLAADPTQVPLLSAANTFVGTQTVGSGDVAISGGNLDLPQTASATVGVITMGGAPFISACCANNTFNTFVGENAGNFQAQGTDNTAVGYQALNSINNLSSTSNTAVGATALRYNTTGTSNTAVGTSALLLNIGGTSNTAVGTSALQSNSQGLYNTAMGQGAGSSNTSGNSNIFIGQGADAGSGSLTNAIAIGANTVVAESNAMVLGGTVGNGNAVSVGIGTSTPAFTLDVHGTANFTGLVNFASGQTFPGAPGPPGAQGAQGPQGVPGTPATVQVGTVTTGAPGSQASITNTGTTSAAVLNFTIPQGINGTGTPPSALMSAFLPGPINQAYTAASFVPDSAITVTRISATLKTAPDATCGPQPAVVRVANGTTGQDVVIAPGQSVQDTGAIEIPAAAGSPLQVSVKTAANCPQTNPADTNVLVEYRGLQTGDTQTCAQSGLVCNGICEESQADPNNCGACGKACGSLPNVSGGGACTSGTCTGYACSSGYADCAGTGNGCNNNLQTDSSNCGSCGNGCSPIANATGVACTSGACSAAGCNSGYKNCGSSCSTLQTDNNNCGACGSVCSITSGIGTAACSSGSCARTCTEGLYYEGNGKATVLNQTLCGSGCSTLSTDPNNCGACGNVCQAQQCVSTTAAVAYTGNTPPTGPVVVSCALCDDADDGPCTTVAAAATCSNGSCQLFPSGYACATNAQCASGVCESVNPDPSQNCENPPCLGALDINQCTNEGTGPSPCSTYTGACK